MKPNRPWLTLLRELYAPPSPEDAKRHDESYGQLLVDLGLATREQVDACLAAPSPAGKPFPRLSRLLIERGVLTREQLAGSVIATAAEEPDNRVERYILVSKLRDESWKAWDTRRRDWAQLTFVSPATQARLRTRAAIVHPGLAAIVDFGADEDRTFVAAEYVSGVSLATAPRTDRSRLVAAVRDAAEAVAALHARKVVHGAISTETILIDDQGKVRVVGWGSDRDDVRALGAALFDVLTDRPAPPQGAPKTWPRRLDERQRAFLDRALTGRFPSANAFAKELAKVF
jgi:serine/threonine protein kinase